MCKETNRVLTRLWDALLFGRISHVRYYTRAVIWNFCKKTSGTLFLYLKTDINFKVNIETLVETGKLYVVSRLKPYS